MEMFNIYVGNLSFDSTEDDVRDLFAAHGFDLRRLERASLLMGLLRSWGVYPWTLSPLLAAS